MIKMAGGLRKRDRQEKKEIFELDSEEGKR